MAIGTVENLTGEISYSREHELTAYGDILAITSATIGITEELTGEQTLTDRYELTTYDDILKIRDAVINLASPAGDLFTSGGNDTVTIENSTIAAQAEGLAFFLGSGNDTLILNNSTLNAPILSGSGNDLVRVVGDSQSRVLLKKRSDTSTLSLGADDDVLELSAVLEGDGDIDFGTGNDTLRFDGGSLLTSGALSVFSRLEVSALGGYLGRDLNLAGELIAITLGGNLTGSDGSRIISISGSDISLNTANNVKTNIAFSISESVFDHKAGGTIEINGYMGYAFQADDATVIFHDLVLSENFCGLYGTNTQWVVERGRFSDNEQAASLTGGTLQLSDVDISSQTAGALNLDNTLFTGADLSFSSNRDTEKMMNQVLPFATSTATSYSSGTSLFHTAIVSAVVTAQGGAIYANTDVSLEQVRFHRNNTEAVISQADDNIARVSAKTTGGFWARATGSAFTSTFATAAGGAIYQAAGDISLSSAVFSGNYATAFASGTATATANVSAFGTGSGSALAIAICSAIE